MKIIVNINREAMRAGTEHLAMGRLDEWQECQGVKLSETPDGSFDLLLTEDMEKARQQGPSTPLGPEFATGGLVPGGPSAVLRSVPPSIKDQSLKDEEGDH